MLIFSNHHNNGRVSTNGHSPDGSGHPHFSMPNGDANFLKPSQQRKGLNSGPSPDGSGHPHFSMLNRDANFLKPSQ
ncbi:hypothetical protein ACSQ67_013761 [Phaseolus vulgaris]